MMGLRVPPEVERQRWIKRLERERKARLEAEAIAEQGLRALYERQQELLLLEAVAEAANTISSIPDAMRFALERICSYTKWPLGHLYLAAPNAADGSVGLVPTDVWHLSNADRYARFREISETMIFAPGVGLPGRVLAGGKPAWIIDVTRDANFPRASQARESGLKAAMGFPVLVGTEVVAVLEFFAEEGHEPDERLLDVMVQIGTQLGRVIERKRAEERLIHARHDSLTQLPNRAALLDRLEQAIKRAKRHAGDTFAVLFMDLDRFKIVNDSLGHIAGDQMLVECARRLTTCLRQEDTLARPVEEGDLQPPYTVARLGGDEFIVLLERIHDVSDGIRVAERLQRELASPFIVAGQQVFTSASIGIALSTTGYSMPEDILRDADIAMYRAKVRGQAHWEVFDQTMRARALARLQIETDLRRALEREEFRVHYQPIVSLASGRICGFEALLRWQHREKGMIPPLEFITVAEETGLILGFGSWVLREACRQIRVWQQVLPINPPLTVSVNLSAKQFAQADLPDQVGRIMDETGVPAGSLELELTETVSMEDVEHSQRSIQALKCLGVRLTIDDFGTGYSSLSYLRRFAVDTLKIDRSFVSQLDVDEESREIVRTITTLAHNMGMEVVAEGTETAAQAAHLRSFGCEYAQGYFFFKPADSRTVETVLRQA
jgi:diguanylate cyclase (GGDEF)-like protein